MSTQLDIYNQLNYDLIASMTIKSEILANLTEELVGKNEGNPNWSGRDKRLWRYYLNLNGQYHKLDEPMFVVSLDTLKEIAFTKENLIDHPNTKEAYTNMVQRTILI